MTPTTPSRLASPEPLAPVVRALVAGTLAPSTYLTRLEMRFAEREPSVSAFLPEPERFARLAREAEALERRHPSPSAPPRRPPLFALPVAVKDVFHAAGLATRAGSRLPEELVAELGGFPPPGADREAGSAGEAEAVARLRRAGALVLGKTVTTELAYFAPGPTRNPHDLDRTPGGSSSGSAAAVAAGLAPLALGTQTIGSVCRPAAFCGIVGFKPTAGRVPRGGLVPLAPSLDQVGLFAADVAGAALAAPALCDGWRGLPALREAPVLGVVEGEYLERAGEAARAIFRRAVGRLREAGARLVAADPFPDFAEIEVRHRAVLAAEAARVHARWFPRRADLCDGRTAELLREGREIGDETLARARDECTAFSRRLGERTAELGVDLWLSPAAPGTAPRGLGSTGDPVMNLPWTQAGVPALSLPCGASPEGLPYGLQLAGRFGEDEALLARALWVEEALAAGDRARDEGDAKSAGKAAR